MNRESELSHTVVLPWSFARKAFVCSLRFITVSTSSFMFLRVTSPPYLPRASEVAQVAQTDIGRNQTTSSLDEQEVNRA